ncbi:FxsA family protein [Devosia rhodophyticola]|uniref:FxsA family protein n=1 Tax=Devosia rhodophyticola TaxID=3026423 RepID=A0ABY7Z2E5_9HYPH|nr:FxsA family protein [Devosia rhodophyticola]WDR07375.1 FxsA family protein [Devosia rhodophyticola]
MARIVIISFLLLPIIEIALFIKVGQTIGLWPTLGLVIAGAIGGVLLLRQQGMSILRQIQTSMNGGVLPGQPLAEAMMLGVAAVFLLLPGLFSDAIALALLVPPVRGWIYRQFASRVVVRGSAHQAQPGGHPKVSRPDTIDLDDDDYRPS